METKTLLQRMHAVMQEVSYVQKDKKPIDGKYRAVKHDDVIAKLRPALVKHGIVVTVNIVSHGIASSWDAEGYQGKLTHFTMTSTDLQVTLYNVDDKADSLTVQAFGYGIDNQDKGPGKAVSYAVKYSLLKTFCLETGDDPDNDQHTEVAPTAPVPPRQEKTQDDRHSYLRRITGLWSHLSEAQRAQVRQRHRRTIRDMEVAELDEVECEINALLSEEAAQTIFTSQGAAA